MATGNQKIEIKTLKGNTVIINANDLTVEIPHLHLKNAKIGIPFDITDKDMMYCVNYYDTNKNFKKIYIQVDRTTGDNLNKQLFKPIFPHWEKEPTTKEELSDDQLRQFKIDFCCEEGFWDDVEYDNFDDYLDARLNNKSTQKFEPYQKGDEYDDCTIFPQ